MSYRTLATDIADFITTHNLHGSHVMGHSLGGKTAMALALQHPQLLKHLAVLDIAPVAYSHTQIDYIQAMQALNLDTIKRRSDADAALQEGVPDTVLRQFLLQNLVPDGDGFEWRINLDALADQMDEMIGFPTFAEQQYNGPTLFIYGMDSDYVLAKYHSAVRTYFPTAQMLGIENAEHWLHVQKPNRVVDAINHFLNAD